MTFEEIDARYRTAVLSGDGDEWDDPESVEEDDDEIGFRDVDEESTFDEAGDQDGEAA
jgi:hypothetical protein